MVENNEILLDYFDSLLTPEFVIPEEQEEGVDNSALSIMLAKITDNVASPLRQELDKHSHMVEELSVPPSLLTDTIAAGYRLIPLIALSTATSVSMSAANNFTISLELLSLATRLAPGRLKQSLIDHCELLDG